MCCFRDIKIDTAVVKLIQNQTPNINDSNVKLWATSKLFRFNI